MWSVDPCVKLRTYLTFAGVCEECRSGNQTYCLEFGTKLRGVNADGCFSEYAIGDAVYTFKIPSKLRDDQAAPLMCQPIFILSTVTIADPQVPV